MCLDRIKNALLSKTDAVYHFSAPSNTSPPYIEWAEDSENVFTAGNRHAETAVQGTVDLYTKSDSDPLRTTVPGGSRVRVWDRVEEYWKLSVPSGSWDRW